MARNKALWLFAGWLTAACGDDRPTATEMTETGEAPTTTAGAASLGSASTDGADSTATTTQADTGGTDSGPASGSGSTAGEGGANCRRTPARADRERFVVVSKPFDAEGEQVGHYEVLSLSTEGELEATGHSFDMRTSVGGHIVFTADGEIGLLAQKDGSVGVFRLDELGQAQVLDEGFRGDFYAREVIMGPEHQRIFVVDSQIADNGGGVIELAVDCEGGVSEVGRVFSGDLVMGVAWVGDGRALVGARGLHGTTTPGHDAFLVDTAGFEVLASGNAFGPEQPLVSAAIVAASGRIGILSDNSEFSGVPYRLAIVSLTDDDLTPVQLISDVLEPYELIASPVDDTALMFSGYGDAIFVLDVDPEAGDPVTIRGELEYAGPGPQLPGKVVMVERGPLTGLVLATETSSIRRIRFVGGGTVTDLGTFEFGAGYENITGAVGVQW